MKIGIMGGTFNPIHTGHLLLAEYAKEACGLDKVFFIPTGNSYMKDAKEIVSEAHRFAMVQLAIQGVEGFEASDIEILREGNTYTCDTLVELKEMYPTGKFYFLTGADSFLSIHKWRNPEMIFANAAIVVVTRDDVSYDALRKHREFLLEKFGGEIEVVSFPTVDISSTEIRRRVKNGQSIRFQTPDSVREYITEKELYRK